MDGPSTDRNNSAKRRCLNDRDSDTLFVSRSPEPQAPEEDQNIDDVSDEDDSDSEQDEPVYDESEEPFPNCPTYDQAINGIEARAQASVQTLDNILEQYESVNEDLKNMKAKTAAALKPKTHGRRFKKVALVGPTGAGTVICVPIIRYVLTLSRQKLHNQLYH